MVFIGELPVTRKASGERRVKAVIEDRRQSEVINGRPWYYGPPTVRNPYFWIVIEVPSNRVNWNEGPFSLKV
jgi:hypothetical protein